MRALVERLAPCLSDTTAEVIFVDDSDDDTPEMVRSMARAQRDSDLKVRLIHREQGDRAGGLGTAVVAGLRAATGEWAVVMDGDLQHPPEVVPKLVAAGEAQDANIVVASRHVEGGDSQGLSGASRVLVSGGATLTARAMFPIRLRGITDPMSGFFAVRRSAIDLDTLRPDGFKILMEILVRTPGLSRTEVGFVFEDRAAGESKASLAEGMRFARHLARLSVSRLSWSNPRTRRALGFAAVGFSGIAVNSAAMWFFSDKSALGLNYLMAATLATQVSTTWNFIFIDQVVYRGPKKHRPIPRYLIFSATNNLVLLARLPVLALLVGTVGMNPLAANLITLVLSFILRFATSDRLIYRIEK